MTTNGNTGVDLKVVGRIGLRAAMDAFRSACEQPLARGRNLHVTVALAEGDSPLVPIGDMSTPHGGEQYKAYTQLKGGKLETVDRFSMHSDAAVRRHGLATVAGGDPNDPRGWPGGMYDCIEIRVADGTTYRLRVGAAASGDHSVVDRIPAAAGATAMTAAWTLAMYEKFGKFQG